MATQQDYDAILMPDRPFRQLKIARYIDRAKKKKLFKGEMLRQKTNGPDDLYYYYIDEGRIRITFMQESGEGVFVYQRNAGNAFMCEYNGLASIGDYAARFTAVKNTVLYAFTQDQLYDLIREDKDVFFELIYVYHMSFAQFGHRISGTGNQSAIARFTMWADKLCATRTPTDDGIYIIPCTLTIKTLSQLLMVHVTTCNKLILSLEGRGIVQRSRTELRIDLAALKAYAEEVR